MKLTERVVGTTNSAFSTGQGEGTCGEYPSWRQRIWRRNNNFLHAFGQNVKCNDEVTTKTTVDLAAFLLADVTGISKLESL